MTTLAKWGLVWGVLFGVSSAWGQATPNAVHGNPRPEARANSPAAAKSAAAQTSIVKATAQPAQHQQQGMRSPVNDDCANAPTFDLYAGSSVTFCDDSTGATEDCPALGADSPEVWYKFTTYETLSVYIRYCGTTPAVESFYIVVDTTCPCSGSFVMAANWENYTCGDGNYTVNWADLPAGTYYWPLLADSDGGSDGPYCVTFQTTAPPPPPPPAECPADTLYGQPPRDQNEYWVGYTSAIGHDFEYTCYENFSGLSDQIGDLHWWGLVMSYDPYYGWLPCDPTGLVFEVKFYNDDAGQPGAVACTYANVAPTIEDQGPYSWAELYYFSLAMPQNCCTLGSGWVSIKSTSSPAGCVFLWLSSSAGDNSSYQQPAGGALEQLGDNLTLCLTSGDCPLLFGACCNDYDGTCTDNVEWGQCPAPLRFTPNTLCADLTPTCGIRGACCDSGLNCVGTVFESECAGISGRFFPGESCDTFVCPPDCAHRIDLYDCYGDGWTDNFLDVLVNGVPVLSQITLPAGYGPLSLYFDAGTGDTIQTIYYPTGYYAVEPYYFIYDGLDYLLGSDGSEGTNCWIEPTGITVTGNCVPPITGACCHFAGGCDVVPEADCNPADSLFLGVGTLCNQCPCFVPCPPGSVAEQEPCGSDTNGGCGADPPAFAPLACGDTICGTLWASTSLRDTDWYEITLDSAQYLTWIATAQIPVEVAILQAPCEGTLLASATAAECHPASVTVEGLAGITYWCRVGPAVWADAPCQQQYVASLTCSPVPTGACCLPNGTCVETTPLGCSVQNGIYQGDDVLCGSVNCEAFYCAAGAQICDEYISRVQIAEIDNPSDCEDGQYADYTDLSATLPYGAGTPLTVTNGNPIWPEDVCSAWIDWNHDYTFDDFAPELSGDVLGVGPYQFQITPPASALLGATSMRIRIDYANEDPNPCGIAAFGEVEDYTVNVIEVHGACCWPDETCTSELPSACGGYWGGPFTQCAGADCNSNGVDDFCDIASGYSGDCDANGVPDECQPFVDCNDNGMADFCDVASGDSPDCNANGVPDECDIADGTSLDCNDNGIPDECEPGGTSDCNNNGMTDLCEIAHCEGLPWCSDCNGDYMPDSCDIALGISADCNGNGIPDECELDGNDCNNNGMPDACDIATGTSCDCQGDGIPDECQIWTGVRDELAWDDGTSTNSLGLTDGGELCWLTHFTVSQPALLTALKTCFGTPAYPGVSGVSAGQAVRFYVWSDPNGDGNPSAAVFLGEATGSVNGGSIDSDVFQSISISQGVNGSFFVGVSVVTSSGGYPAPMDEDGPQYGEAWLAFNTVPFDPTSFGNLYNMTDIGYPCNWLLRAEVTLGPPPNDCNQNGIPDECDIGVEWGGDCTGQGGCWPTTCASDWNHNGIPDSCEICGDIDNDQDVDINDYWMFVSAFGACVGSPNYNAEADLDGDGCVTLVDYQAWRVCYKMANDKDFVLPKPKPIPAPQPTKTSDGVVR